MARRSTGAKKVAFEPQREEDDEPKEKRESIKKIENNPFEKKEGEEEDSPVIKKHTVNKTIYNSVYEKKEEEEGFSKRRRTVKKAPKTEE